MLLGACWLLRNHETPPCFPLASLFLPVTCSSRMSVTACFTPVTFALTTWELLQAIYVKNSCDVDEKKMYCVYHLCAFIAKNVFQLYCNQKLCQ